MNKSMACSFIFAVGALIVNLNAFAVGVVKQTAVISGAPKHIGLGWSDDNQHFIISEYRTETQRHHLCIYRIEPLKRIKCVVALSSIPEWYVGQISWAGSMVYVEEGYDDGGTTVSEYKIDGWKDTAFREIDGGREEDHKGLNGSGGRPVWDERQNGFYYQRDWVMGDIFFYKGGKQRLVIKSGFEPAVSERYLWYVLGEPRSGLYQRDRRTHHEVRIAEEAESISATQDDNLLFVLQAERTEGYRNALFAYQVRGGHITRLFDVSGSIGETKEVAVSRDGQYALVEILTTDKKRDPLKFFYDLILLRLDWQSKGPPQINGVTH